MAPEGRIAPPPPAALPKFGRAYVEARLAGKKPDAAAAHAGAPADHALRLEAHPAVQAHLRLGRHREIAEDEIVDFWGATMADGGTEMQHRLKASELLARSKGMLKDKLEVSGGLTLEQLVPKRKPAAE